MTVGTRGSGPRARKKATGAPEECAWTLTAERDRRAPTTRIGRWPLAAEYLSEVEWEICHIALYLYPLKDAIIRNVLLGIV